MNKVRAHNKIWELLVSQQALLLQKWKHVRFDQTIILINGEHHDTMGKVLTEYCSRVWVYKGLNDPSIGGYTGYYGVIDVDDGSIECRIVDDCTTKWGPDEGGPMILKVQTFHENNPHILDDNVVAKQALDVIMNWLEYYEAPITVAQ